MSDTPLNREGERRKLALEINAAGTSGPDLDVREVRKRLEAEHGQVWCSEELEAEFEIMGWGDPLVVVCRRKDKVRGSLIFQHAPRFYWGWEPCD